MIVRPELRHQGPGTIWLGKHVTPGSHPKAGPHQGFTHKESVRVGVEYGTHIFIISHGTFKAVFNGKEHTVFMRSRQIGATETLRKRKARLVLN